MIFKEYERSYKNFGRCMQCFKEIILICETRQDYTIAKLIENCLDDLEVKR